MYESQFEPHLRSCAVSLREVFFLVILYGRLALILTAEVGRHEQNNPWIRCYSYNTTDRRYTQVTIHRPGTGAQLGGSKGANIRNRTDGDDLVRVRLLVIALLDVRKVARLGKRGVVPVQLPQPAKRAPPGTCQHARTLVER